MPTCERCGADLSLGHHCRVTPTLPQAPLPERARQALTMAADYPIDPLLLELAAEYLRLMDARGT